MHRSTLCRWRTRRLRITVAGLAVVFLSVGCVSVDYVGKTFPPTSHVDLYLSAADVKRPYQVIGTAHAEVEALPFSSPGQQLQDKLLLEARSRGADGLILGPLGKHESFSTQQTTGRATSKKRSGGKKKTDYVTTTTTTPSEVTELTGTLIRYTGS
jgi:hypothetical protein